MAGINQIIESVNEEFKRNKDEIALLKKLVPMVSKYRIKIIKDSSYYYEGSTSDKMKVVVFSLNFGNVELASGEMKEYGDWTDKQILKLEELFLNNGFYVLRSKYKEDNFQIKTEEMVKKEIKDYVDHLNDCRLKSYNEIEEIKAKLSVLEENKKIFKEEIGSQKALLIKTSERHDHYQKEEIRVNKMLARSKDNVLKLMTILE